MLLSHVTSWVNTIRQERRAKDRVILSLGGLRVTNTENTNRQKLAVSADCHRPTSAQERMQRMEGFCTTDSKRDVNISAAGTTDMINLDCSERQAVV